jgi:hypothetical protein
MCAHDFRCCFFILALPLRVDKVAFYELRKSLVSLEGMERRRKGGDMVIVDCA